MTALSHLLGFFGLVFLGGVAFQAADVSWGDYRRTGASRYAIAAACAFSVGLCLTALGLLVLVRE